MPEKAFSVCIKDSVFIEPACGSADFLVAAFRAARKFNPGFADCIWGIDNSPNAVQVAVLNMLLNGDGKTNVIKDDSLENIKKYVEKYDYNKLFKKTEIQTATLFNDAGIIGAAFAAKNFK